MAIEPLVSVPTSGMYSKDSDVNTYDSKRNAMSDNQGKLTSSPGCILTLLIWLGPGNIFTKSLMYSRCVTVMDFRNPRLVSVTPLAAGACTCCFLLLRRLRTFLPIYSSLKVQTTVTSLGGVPPSVYSLVTQSLESVNKSVDRKHVIDIR